MRAKCQGESKGCKAITDDGRLVWTWRTTKESPCTEIQLATHQIPEWWQGCSGFNWIEKSFRTTTLTLMIRCHKTHPEYPPAESPAFPSVQETRYAILTYLTLNWNSHWNWPPRHARPRVNSNNIYRNVPDSDPESNKVIQKWEGP